MHRFTKSVCYGLFAICGLMPCPAFGQQAPPVTNAGSKESAEAGRNPAGQNSTGQGIEDQDGGSARAPEVTAGWLPLGNLSNPAAAIVESTRQKLEKLEGLKIVPANQLLRKLRRIDRESNLSGLCSEGLEKAKGLQLGMKLDEAAKLLERVIERQRSGFVEYYDPAAAAAPYLQLGVVLVQSGHIEAAEAAMRKALRLVPTLGLSGAWYSPSVIKVFERVRKLSAGTNRELPAVDEAARLCSVLELDALVVTVETFVGGQRVLQSALYIPPAGAWEQIATVPLVKVEEASEQLREVFTARLVERFPALKSPEKAAVTPSTSGRKVHGVQELHGTPPGPLVEPPPFKPHPPPEPWYSKHWWIWPVAAAVTAAAIALPLTVFRREVIRIDVR